MSSLKLNSFQQTMFVNQLSQSQLTLTQLVIFCEVVTSCVIKSTDYSDQRKNLIDHVSNCCRAHWEMSNTTITNSTTRINNFVIMSELLNGLFLLLQCSTNPADTSIYTEIEPGGYVIDVGDLQFIKSFNEPFAILSLLSDHKIYLTYQK